MTVSASATPSFLQKLVLNKLGWLLFCGFFFSYPVYRAFHRELPPELPIISQIAEFSFQTDQKEVFGSQELRGRSYIASFFCLECKGSEEQFKRLQKIQKRVKGLTTSVALVSFTTTPEQDSVKKLFKKGRELHSNPFVWKWLTSSQSNAEVLSFLKKNYRLDEAQLTDKFVLVDELGRVRGYYYDNKNDINKMMIDLGLVINRQRLNFKQVNKESNNG